MLDTPSENPNAPIAQDLDKIPLEEDVLEAIRETHKLLQDKSKDQVKAICKIANAYRDLMEDAVKR